LKRFAPLLVIILVVGLLAALNHRAFSEPVPIDRIKSLQKGMTQDEVQSILGPPSKIHESGQWTYQRAWVLGFVNIHWKSDGTFNGDFNYERF